MAIVPVLLVWHEVAQWLGYETEEQVEALGL